MNLEINVTSPYNPNKVHVIANTIIPLLTNSLDFNISSLNSLFFLHSLHAIIEYILFIFLFQINCLSFITLILKFMDTNWYVVKVIPGKERSLTEQFNKEIKLGRIDNINRFICPTEKEFVVVKKKKVLREKVIYSGYLYFESIKKLSQEELKVISTIPNIMGMMGDKMPLLLNSIDVRRILKDDTLEEHIESKKLKFLIGETIIVNDGPFNNFNGTIMEINGDKVNVEIKIFGRNTAVSLSLDQIQKP